MELLVFGFIVLLAVGCVIFITRGLFARDLTQALKRVTQQEQELQEKAGVLEERVSQMEREYHAKLKRAELEADQMLQEAKQQALNIRTAAIEEAKHRARQLILEAEQGRARLKTEVGRELNAQVVQRAAEALRDTLLPEQLTALHEALVRELLEALRGMEMGPLRGHVDQVHVVTAQPLASGDALRLAQWAAASVGADVPITTATAADLVAGCVVRMGSTVVDNTLVHRLRNGG